MVLIAWSTMAMAAAPECAVGQLPTPPEALSVAWVSRLGARARGGSWLAVVPTSDLRGFVAAEPGSVARLLQHVGLRRRDREPRRRFKVVVFDVVRGSLCRPVAEAEVGVLSDVATCDERRSRPGAETAGCGYTIDRATGQEGLPLYRAQWSELARNGFCVLPAERFVAGP